MVTEEFSFICKRDVSVTPYHVSVFASLLCNGLWIDDLHCVQA